MTLEQRIDAYFEDPAAEKALISAITRLCSIPSVSGPAGPGMPFGPGPAAALDEALRLASEMGFSTRNYDGYVGLADYNSAPDALHILGHLDVVAPGSGWTVTEPFAPRLKDGVLYGRGVADDKGPVAAAILAMKALRDLGVELSGNVRLIMGTDEESGSSDIACYYAHEPYAPHAFTPDADFPLIHIEKGHYHPDFGASWPEEAALPRVKTLRGGIRPNVVPPEAEAVVEGLSIPALEPACDAAAGATGVSFVLSETPDGCVAVKCMGRNAHASTPQEGCNAITALLSLLAALPLAPGGGTKAISSLHTLFPHGDTAGEALGIAQSDEASGALTLNLALIDLTSTGFSAKFDARFPLCANEENCKKAAEAAFARHGIAVTGAGELLPAHEVRGDSPFVRTLLSCYETYTGEKNPKPIAIGGGTYVHNIPGGVAFGPNMPGFDCCMHAADERIRVKDLLTACKIYALAIAKVCK